MVNISVLRTFGKTFAELIFILVVLFCLFACKQKSIYITNKNVPNPEFYSITANDTLINRFGLVELNVELNAVFDNPFDPQQIELTATFVSPSGKTEVVDGFYFQDFSRDFVDKHEVLKEKGNTYWKIRYSPKEVGIYTYYLLIKNYSKSVTSSTNKFTSADSSLKGFIRRNPSNTIYLEFDNKTPYFPVGMSVAWVEQINGTYDYDYYFKKLKENNCNYSRIWLVEWNLPLEWINTNETKGTVAGLGRYSLDNSWRLDYILEEARKNNLYLLITLGTYGEIMSEQGDWGENKWKNNPYNLQNGGMCQNPEDFFTNRQARDYYKNRLRYIISRWGYSSNIMAFELWNEVDAPVDWIIEQSSYIKQKDINKHLVTTSIGYPFNIPNEKITDETWKLNNIDFVQTHLYGKGGDIVYLDKEVAELSKSNIAKYNKPHFFAEFGIDFFKDDLYYDTKGSGTQIHNVMWSSLMNLSMGAAVTHWKEYIDQKDLYHEFKAISTFIQNINLETGGWNYLNVSQTFCESMDSTTYTYPVVSEWGKNPNGPVILEQGKTNQHINSFIHAKSNSNQAQYYTPEFLIDFNKEGKFIIDVNEVSENASLKVYIDDQLTWEHTFNANSRELNKIYNNNKYNNKTLVFNKSYGIPISAGKHKIRIENTGNDWLSVKKYSIVLYNNKYTVYGIGNKKEIIGWVNNLNNNWKYINANSNLPALKNISFIISNLPNNTYKIDWFDTETGLSINSEKLICTNGYLKLKIPSLQKDKAFIIRPIL